MNFNPIDRPAAAFARRETLLWTGAALLGGALLANQINACGPFFPNRFLDRGDEAVLAAPYADFHAELARLKLPPSPAREPVSSPPLDETVAAELADLRAALAKAGELSVTEREAVVMRHFGERSKLVEQTTPRFHDNVIASAPDVVPVGPSPHRAIVVQPELPAEFADYLLGAVAWKHGDTNAAIAAWERVLALPASERRYKSTWAAYMLGRARRATDPARAEKDFQQVRLLVQDGFVDRLGLAAASLGWEAWTCLRQGKYYGAARLYLEQAESGNTDPLSLQETMSAALYHCESYDEFARHPKLRRILTAHLLDTGRGGNPVDESTIGRWLAALEGAKVMDLELAEELALLCYRYGEFDFAQRWLKAAPVTPVTQWVRAKLLLRDGRLDEATVLLAQITRHFPVVPPDAPASGLKDAIFFDTRYEREDAGRHLQAELGTLRLARREFVASLDCFMQAGAWSDAAFVAERVLTVAELQSYVDAHWPDAPPAQSKVESDEVPDDVVPLAGPGGELRYLLARRLARENHGAAARPYFPARWTGRFDELIRELVVAWDESRPKMARVAAFVAAGRIVRAEGMELIGTELEPDYFIHAGDFQDGITPHGRVQGNFSARRENHGDFVRPPEPLLLPSAEERRRTAIEPADPPQRFHYRYIAADLLWRAAEMLPDNTDKKARVLCEAGTWLKNTHPMAADRYYKALVRKCGQTAIGKLADNIRWFPWLDSDGNLAPDQPSSRTRPEPAQEVPQIIPPE